MHFSTFSRVLLQIHWLKTDFKRWIDLDSDASDEEVIDDDTDLSKVSHQELVLA